MHLTLVDHAKFEIAVRWRGRDGVPLDHALLLPTAAVESVRPDPAGALRFVNRLALQSKNRYLPL